MTEQNLDLKRLSLLKDLSLLKRLLKNHSLLPILGPSIFEKIEAQKG